MASQHKLAQSVRTNYSSIMEGKPARGSGIDNELLVHS